MQKSLAWGVSAALVGVLLAAYYAWRWVVTSGAAPPVEPPTQAAPALQAAAEPAIHYPIERVPRSGDAVAVAPASAPLPLLDASDAEIQDAIARLIGRVAFHQFIQPEALIRHIVVTVDNLPRKTIASRLSPVKPIPGPFLSSSSAERATLASANASRYTPYVSALEALDTPKLVAVYAYFYPLFQQAYRELGYPRGYFNDRLVEAIDVMLATPEVSDPALVQPRVLYEFADPDLEALPVGEKIMLRMGPDQAARVKAKLTEIRQALTGRAMPAASGARRETSSPSAPSAPAPSSTTTSGG